MDEETKAYRATYSKVAAAQELQEQSFLVEVFASHWKNKHRGNYIFPVNNSHFAQMRDFRKAAGPKAAELIEHFFSMRDDWFLQQRYSLDCLLKNINKVNASFSSTAHARESSGKATIPFYCDSCWEQFITTVPITYNFDRPTRCPECEKENKPLKKASKQQRETAVIRFGNVFLDVEQK